MVPSTTLGLLIFVSVLAPGIVWLRLTERRTLRRRRSTALEIAEIAVLGGAFTAIAVLLVVLVSEVWSPPLLDVSSWVEAADRSDYLVGEIQQAAFSSLVVLTTSVGVAALAAGVVHRAKDVDIRPESTVWYDVFGLERNGRQAFLGIKLTDGRGVEGYLHSYPVDTDDDQLALKAPIFYRNVEAVDRIRSPLEIVVLPKASIVDIGVIYMEPLGEEPPRGPEAERTMSPGSPPRNTGDVGSVPTERPQGANIPSASRQYASQRRQGEGHGQEQTRSNS